MRTSLSLSLSLSFPKIAASRDQLVLESERGVGGETVLLLGTRGGVMD